MIMPNMKKEHYNEKKFFILNIIIEQVSYYFSYNMLDSSKILASKILGSA